MGIFNLSFDPGSRAHQTFPITHANVYDGHSRFMSSYFTGK
jgi:hypothetical protein